MKNFENNQSLVSIEDKFFYIVTGLVTEFDSGFVDFFRWVFGIDLYSNVKTMENCFTNFQFSKVYSYSVFTPLIDGCFDMNLRYFIFFSIFNDLSVFDAESIEDDDFQIQIDFQNFLDDISSVADFLYFVGVGFDLLILYDDLNYFIQFMVQNNFGSNAWVIVLLVRNFSFFPFLINWV